MCVDGKGIKNGRSNGMNEWIIWFGKRLDYDQWNLDILDEISHQIFIDKKVSENGAKVHGH